MVDRLIITFCDPTSDVRTPLRTVTFADTDNTPASIGWRLCDAGTALQCESLLGRHGDPSDISRIHLADNPDTGSCDPYCGARPWDPPLRHATLEGQAPHSSEFSAVRTMT